MANQKSVQTNLTAFVNFSPIEAPLSLLQLTSRRAIRIVWSAQELDPQLVVHNTLIKEYQQVMSIADDLFGNKLTICPISSHTSLGNCA